MNGAACSRPDTAATAPALRDAADAADAASASTRLGALAGACYGALGAPLAFVAVPLYVHLPAHAAAQFGMSIAVVGGVLLATRLLDAVVDPWLGQVVDRLFVQSVRRAWALAAAAAVVLASAFAVLFTRPAPGQAAAWLAGWLIAVYLAYSTLSIVHQAWGTRWGGNVRQRSEVVAWREGFGVGGVLLASVLPTLWGFATTSLVLALALAAGIGLLAALQREQQHAVLPTKPVVNPRTLPWRNPHFRSLLTIFLVNGIASAIPATLVTFFVTDRLQLAPMLPAFLAAYFASAVLSLPLWLAAIRRFGLMRSWLAAMLLSIVAFVWAAGLHSNEWLGFLFVCIASGMALGADLTVPGALLTGVVQRAGHGDHAAASYVGWWTAATKLNLALAAGIALPILSLAGYEPGLRTPAALQALGLIYVAVPCSLKLVAAALVWRRRNDFEGELA